MRDIGRRGLLGRIFTGGLAIGVAGLIASVRPHVAWAASTCTSNGCLNTCRSSCSALTGEWGSGYTCGPQSSCVCRNFNGTCYWTSSGIRFSCSSYMICSYVG